MYNKRFFKIIYEYTQVMLSYLFKVEPLTIYKLLYKEIRIEVFIMKFIKGIFVSTIALTAFTGLELIKFHENPNVVYADSKGPVKNITQSEADIKEEDQIIVKFKSEVNFPYKDGLEKQIKNEDSDLELVKIFSEFPQLTLKRLFTSVDPKEIENIDKDTRETEKIIF